MLNAVADSPDFAVFRTYGWSVPTLSLGYFQHVNDLEADPRWHDAAVVRRLTGGGAIWHHHEVTYALILPTTHPRSGRGGQLYECIHSIIANVLRQHGVDARRRGEYNSKIDSQRPFLCFADRDAEDLVIGNAKIVGSAQRRRAGAVLQHGSLLLQRSDSTPELPGLRELCGESTTATNWSDLLRDPILSTLELESMPSALSESERFQIHALTDEVYRNPSWTRRR